VSASSRSALSSRDANRSEGPRSAGDEPDCGWGRGNVLRVKPLVWCENKAGEVCTWAVHEPSNALQVSADTVSLLQLGTATRDDFDLSIKFRQLNQVGQVGVFLDYQEDHKTGKELPPDPESRPEGAGV
jgi:hypothetical protein